MNATDTAASIVENAPDWLDAEYFDHYAEDPEDLMDWLRDLQYGGCASGMYMPAVTYSTALKTMSDHGDDVLQYIEEQYDELPAIPKGASWSGIAVHYLSIAVELWCLDALSQMEDADDEE